jgi:type I restriction enzyme S subunit
VSEEHNELPESWVWTTLSNVASINPKLDISALPDSTLVSFVPMAAVEAETGRIDTSTQRRLDEVKRGFTSFQEGDVLFAKITPCMENGKSAVARSLSSGIGYGSTEFHVVRPLLDINPQLLNYYVAQESFRQTARAHMTGSAGQLRVPTSFVADAPYPLAPLPEQYRIVSAIEQQFTRLDAGVAALRRAQAKLKRYRAAVLKAAVEGKLTEAWRAEHPTTEPASILLERILKERRARWEADLKAKGRDPTKVKYVEPAKPDRESLPELPEGWCYTLLPQLLSITRKGITTGPFGSLLKKHEHRSEGVPVLGIENIEAMKFVPGSKVYISIDKAEQLSKYSAQAGDVLVSRSGTVGEVCVVPGHLGEARISTNVVRISLASHGMLSQFFCLLFNGSPFILKQISELCKGSLRDFLNQAILSSIILPLPPVAEQQQIISEVDQRLSVITQLEAIVEANLKRAERLRQSFLKEAFAGRLVPQDPNDEPASVLLERIRKEREGRQKGIVGNGRYVEVPGEPVKIDLEGTRQVELWEGV